MLTKKQQNRRQFVNEEIEALLLKLTPCKDEDKSGGFTNPDIEQVREKIWTVLETWQDWGDRRLYTKNDFYPTIREEVKA